jgi:hypothetical protein
MSFAYWSKRFTGARRLGATAAVTSELTEPVAPAAPLAAGS